MAVQWYYRDSGREFGPMTAQDLRNKALSGQIRPETHVRKGAEGNWILAQQVRGLFDMPTSSDKAALPPDPKDQDAMSWLNDAESIRTTLSAGEAEDEVYSLATPTTETTHPFHRPGPRVRGRFEESNQRGRENGKPYRALQALARFYRAAGFLSFIGVVFCLVALGIILMAAYLGKMKLGSECPGLMIAVFAEVIQGVFFFAIAEAILLAIDVELNTRTTNELLRKVLDSTR